MDEMTAARIRANPDFVELERERRTFGWTLTVIMLVIYYGFVLLVAFAPATIGQSASGSITIGIVLGIGVIVSAIVLTGIYVARANGRFDSLSRRVVADARVREPA